MQKLIWVQFKFDEAVLLASGIFVGTHQLVSWYKHVPNHLHRQMFELQPATSNNQTKLQMHLIKRQFL